MSLATPEIVQGSPRLAGRAPFLFWPVGLREFYTSLSVALAPAMAWGVVLFGWRALLLMLSVVSGALVCHAVLARFTRRGQFLVYGHTVASALLVAALSHALWPWPILFAAGGAVVLLIWLFKGPGNELVHPGLSVALLLWLTLGWLTAPSMLVSDRLVTGDLADAVKTPYYHWPRSYEIDGREAVIIHPPADTLHEVYEGISTYIAGGPITALQEKLEVLVPRWLPWPVTLLVGVYPGTIGTVSTLGILLGGCYLAYRNVLRPRSTALFLAAVTLGLLVAPLTLRSVQVLHWRSLAGIWAVRPTAVVTYLSDELFSMDVVFAAVFVLAMPGSLPITRRGRRWFIVGAGLLVALAHRLIVPTPAATWVLLAMQPLAPTFDRFLGRRSWLDG